MSITLGKDNTMNTYFITLLLLTGFAHETMAIYGAVHYSKRQDINHKTKIALNYGFFVAPSNVRSNAQCEQYQKDNNPKITSGDWKKAHKFLGVRGFVNKV